MVFLVGLGGAGFFKLTLQYKRSLKNAPFSLKLPSEASASYTATAPPEPPPPSCALHAEALTSAAALGPPDGATGSTTPSAPSQGYLRAEASASAAALEPPAAMDISEDDDP